jgi:hypothetical protein
VVVPDGWVAVVVTAADVSVVESESESSSLLSTMKSTTATAASTANSPALAAFDCI